MWFKRRIFLKGWLHAAYALPCGCLSDYVINYKLWAESLVVSGWTFWQVQQQHRKYEEPGQFRWCCRLLFPSFSAGWSSKDRTPTVWIELPHTPWCMITVLISTLFAQVAFAFNQAEQSRKHNRIIQPTYPPANQPACKPTDQPTDEAKKQVPRCTKQTSSETISRQDCKKTGAVKQQGQTRKAWLGKTQDAALQRDGGKAIGRP